MPVGAQKINTYLTHLIIPQQEENKTSVSYLESAAKVNVYSGRLLTPGVKSLAQILEFVAINSLHCCVITIGKKLSNLLEGRAGIWVLGKHVL